MKSISGPTFKILQAKENVSQLVSVSTLFFTSIANEMYVTRTILGIFMIIFFFYYKIKFDFFIDAAVESNK